MAGVMRRPRSALVFLTVGFLAALLVTCEEPRRSAPSAQNSSVAGVTRQPAKTEITTPPPLMTPAPPDPALTFTHPPANTAGCPDGMVRVTGAYCPGVIQTCEKYHEEYLHSERNGAVSERCLKFKEPSRCVVDQRKKLDFCMDRYEYPNQLGVLPRVLTSWRQAQFMCREQGKRLCSEDEFNFACEGPEMLPYVTGYDRDASKCNIDREYHRPNHDMRMFTYETCLEDDACRAEFERLDQRQPIGASLSCVSWAGVVDLNGNVNEWVRRPHKEPPNRSGLKGGWWGPVRNRCRPTVGFHKEFDYGYEAGFRCCKGLGPESPDARYEAEHFNISPEQLAERKVKQAREAAKRALGTDPASDAPLVVPVPSESRAPTPDLEPPNAARKSEPLEPVIPTAPAPTPDPARPASGPSKTPAPPLAPAPTAPTPSVAPRRDSPAPTPGNTPPS